MIDSVNNFTVETDEVLLLEYANLHSLTFPIHRNEPNGLLENLVLSYQNDGTYKAKILQYNLTEQEKVDLANNNLKTISNPIVTLPINFDTNLVVNACEVVTETVYFYCSSGEHSYSTGTAQLCEFWVPGSNGFPPRMATKTTIKCIDEGGSGTGGDTTDPNYDPSGGGGGDGTNNNYPVDYPTPETDPSEYEEGISTPVKPKLDAPQKTPCEHLQTMLNNQITYNRLYNLRNNTNLNYETGFCVKKDSQFGRLDPLPADASTQNPNEIKMETGDNYVGAFHTHPLASSTQTTPMFSDGDINWLFWVAFDNKIPRNQKDYSEFFLTLTVPQGTFAIKIKDWQKFSDFRMSSIWTNSNNFRKGKIMKLRNKFEAIRPNGDFNRMKNALLEILQDSGVGLYQANEDLSSWKELELAPGATYLDNTNPIEKPC